MIIFLYNPATILPQILFGWVKLGGKIGLENEEKWGDF
jgi:hypothetical protein